MTGLCTDPCEIRIAVSYLRRWMTAPATFSLFARALPAARGFLVAAGLADCLSFLERFRFTEDELDYLRNTAGLAAAACVALWDLRDAVMLTELAEEEIEEGNLAALPRLVGDYARHTGTRVTVVDRTGALLTDSHASAPRNADLSGSPDIVDALRNRPTVTTHVGETADVLAVTMPAASGSLVRSAVRVTASTATVAGHARRMWLILGLVALGVLAAAAVIGFAISRWITRPLRALEQATVEFADGVLSQPPDESAGPPEPRRLSAAFTRTANRLQHLLQAQHLFAAEASHQLKTPLTTLRLRLENLEPELHPATHAGLDDALGEIDRLDRLVHGLLALARLENSATKPQAVDLDAVVAERAETWSAFAAEHDVTITVVVAVPGAVEQIIDNLLANALRVALPAARSPSPPCLAIPSNCT